MKLIKSFDDWLIDRFFQPMVDWMVTWRSPYDVAELLLNVYASLFLASMIALYSYRHFLMTLLSFLCIFIIYLWLKGTIVLERNKQGTMNRWRATCWGFRPMIIVFSLPFELIFTGHYNPWSLLDLLFILILYLTACEDCPPPPKLSYQGTS